ncbi:hypothetical protein, partial [Bacillus cereus]|uniref:hypothetical protein n=1 Tax=Bacillus cereus TaxID=1396 RepID=UPI0028527154
LEEVSRELSQVVSPIEQDMYLSQLATEFQLSRETLQKQIRDFRRENQTNRTNQPTTLPTSYFTDGNNEKETADSSRKGGTNALVQSVQ